MVRAVFPEDSIEGGLLTARSAPKWELMKPPILWKQRTGFP